MRLLFCFALVSTAGSPQINLTPAQVGCQGYYPGTVAWLTGYCQIIGAVCVSCIFFCMNEAGQCVWKYTDQA